MAYNYGNYNYGLPQYQFVNPTSYTGGNIQQPLNQKPPMQIPQNLSQPSINQGFVWVQGEAGAKAYPVAAGNSVLLMDSENPVLYMKSTDQSGRPLPIEIYDLVKRQDTPPPQVQSPHIDMTEYVKLSDLDSILESKVEALVNKALGE